MALLCLSNCHENKRAINLQWLFPCIDCALRGIYNKHTNMVRTANQLHTSKSEVIKLRQILILKISVFMLCSVIYVICNMVAKTNIHFPLDLDHIATFEILLYCNTFESENDRTALLKHRLNHHANELKTKANFLFSRHIC